jgi:hypothetical protein
MAVSSPDMEPWKGIGFCPAAEPMSASVTNIATSAREMRVFMLVSILGSSLSVGVWDTETLFCP